MGEGAGPGGVRGMGEGALSYPVHPESGSQMPGTPTLPTSLTAKPLFCSGRRPRQQEGTRGPSRSAVWV